MNGTIGTAEMPTIDLDPYSDEVMLDPYPFFEKLREAPVSWIEPLQCYAVGRFDEVSQVASDYARFSSEGGVGYSDIRKPGALRARSPITEVDPPEHSKARSTLQKLLSPAIVRKWRDAFDAHAELVVQKALAKGDVDGVKDIAVDFVLGAFPPLLGIDMPRENLIVTGELNHNQLGPNNERLRRSLKEAAPYLEWYDKVLSREYMQPGGLGEQMFIAEDEGGFAPGTGRLHLRSFFRASVDTTMAAIGFTLEQLARRPDQYEAVRSDPEKVKAAFEESLRFESPALVMYRVTTKDVELSGYKLKDDTKVAWYPGAANRDPRQFENPDEFDLNREGLFGVQRAFGFGIHVCVGQMIARFEGQSILRALTRHVSRIELTGEPQLRLVNSLRNLGTLPLRLHA